MPGETTRATESWGVRAGALAFAAGIAGGAWCPAFGVWFVVAGLGLLGCWRGWRRVGLCLAVVGLGGSWSVLRAGGAADAAGPWVLGSEPALAEVEGVVSRPAVTWAGTAGPFAAFGYEPPRTSFEVRLDRVRTAGGWREVPGRVFLRVRMRESEHRVRPGQRLRLRGWASAIGPPKNPGEFDYRAAMAERGVVGRISLVSRGNVDFLAEPGWRAWLLGPGSAVGRFRGAVAARAGEALRVGMADDPQTLGLLQTLLLGRTVQDIDVLRERFRAVGLAHLLSISGAHLGILMGLAWLVARGLVPRPGRAAAWVLAVLGLYLLAVPWRVPIVRASVMAGLFFAGLAAGRRTGAETLLAVAALGLLVWRPGDLLTPGFQLSFVTVWALLRFTEPVSRVLWPEPLIPDPAAGVAPRGWPRWLADAAAVSVVATATAAPLVAHHFSMVNPWSVLLSVLALPPLTAVLALGYLKVVVGVVVPSGAVLLSGPLRWAGTSLSALVEQASAWPGATWRLDAAPSWAWTAGAVAVAWAWFGGRFATRRALGLVAVGVVAGWLVVGEWQAKRGETLPLRMVGQFESAAATDRAVATSGGGGELAMVAVGDGSCFVWRSGGRTLVFDCGSQQFPLIGRRSVVPTLRALGVRRIDVLVVSHADLDHYNGVPDVAGAVPVGEVWVSADVTQEAERHPDRATAHLLRELDRLGHAPRVVAAGDRRVFGGSRLEVLWPPPGGAAGWPGWDEARGNDRSVVLSIETAGRRVLLSGDVQQDAITELLSRSRDKLDADVADLPHHGSYVDASPAWLDAVSPAVVLQSSGPARLRNDRWAEPLRQRDIPRLVSDRDGFARVRIAADGAVMWSRFLDGPSSTTPTADDASLGVGR
ncbi:MAG: ComEC/Rec2 family competence protein [Planctomycetota bacterium]